MTITCTKPGFYRTRDGRKALVGPHENVLIGIILPSEGFTATDCWELNGHYKNPFRTNMRGGLSADLIAEWEEPKKAEGWVPVLSTGEIPAWGYKTREDAMNADVGHGYAVVDAVYVSGEWVFSPKFNGHMPKRIADLETRLQRILENAQDYSGDIMYRMNQIEELSRDAFPLNR